MEGMPPRKSPQRGPEPPPESCLTVPLSEAQTVLNERVLLGREMESREIKTQDELERLQIWTLGGTTTARG